MQVPVIFKNKMVQLTSVAIVALATGGVGGYLLGKKKGAVVIRIAPKPTQLSIFDETPKPVRSDPELEKLLDDEERMVEDRRVRDLDNATGSIPSSRLIEDEVARRQLEKDVPDEDTPEPEPVNVFTIDDGDWIWERELETRKGTEPYIIHQEEFISDEMGYHQETLTYYKGDDIMADSTDTPIYNYTGMMGELRFGHGSKDSNVVYIRNEGIHMEWEILLHLGTFESEVLGLSMEKEAEEEDQIRHSVQKFRRE